MAIFRAIGVTNKYFVEFGWKKPQGSNTLYLSERGFNGLLLDGIRDNPKINLHAHWIFQDNICSLFEKHGVPKNFDYLSVDMDSHDHWVLSSIFRCGYRPRVVSTEFSSNWGLVGAFAFEDPSMLGIDLSNYEFVPLRCVWGVSARASEMLATEFGYSIVGRVHDLDLFWIRNDVLQLHGLHAPPLDYIGIPEGLHNGAAVIDQIRKVVDYETFVATGDLSLSKSASMNRMLALHRHNPCLEGALDKLLRG